MSGRRRRRMVLNRMIQSVMRSREQRAFGNFGNRQPKTRVRNEDRQHFEHVRVGLIRRGDRHIKMTPLRLSIRARTRAKRERELIRVMLGTDLGEGN